MNIFDKTLSSLLLKFTTQELKTIINLNYNKNDLLETESLLYSEFKDINKVELIINNLEEISKIKEDSFLLEETKKVLKIKNVYCEGCLEEKCLDCKFKKEYEEPLEEYQFNKVVLKNKKTIKKYSKELEDNFIFSHIEEKLQKLSTDKSKLFLFPIGFDIKFSILLYIFKDKNNISVICDDEEINLFLKSRKIEIFTTLKSRRQKLKEKVALVNVKDESVFVKCKNKKVFLFYYQVRNLIKLCEYFQILPKEVFLFKNTFFKMEFCTPSNNQITFLEEGSNHLGYFCWNNSDLESHNTEVLKLIDELTKPILIFTTSKKLIYEIFKKRLAIQNEINFNEIPELTKEQQNFISQRICVITKETLSNQRLIIQDYFNEGKIDILISDSFINLQAKSIIFSKIDKIKPCFLNRKESQKVVFLGDKICKPKQLKLKTSLFNLVNSVLQKEDNLEELYKNTFYNYEREEVNYFVKKIIYFDLVKYGNNKFLPTKKGKLVDRFDLHQENINLFFDSTIITDKDVLILLSKAYEFKIINFNTKLTEINLEKPTGNRIFDEINKNVFVDFPILCQKNDFIYEFYNFINHKKSKLTYSILSLLNCLFFIFVYEQKEKSVFILKIINKLINKNDQVKYLLKNDLIVLKGNCEIDLFLFNFNGDKVLEHKRVSFNGKKEVKFNNKGIVCIVSGQNEAYLSYL